MKRIILLLAIATLSISCTKDELCECDYFEMMDIWVDCNFIDKWYGVRIDNSEKERAMIEDAVKYKCREDE